jgi:hypothetical protein
MNSSINPVDQSTISYRYRHKNQNSIYYLKPRSNEIWILDFKVQGFVKENLTGKVLLPDRFSSIQLQNGHIYIVGGMIQDLISRNSYEIDGNMNIIDRPPMSKARYNCSLTLIFERFIFAIGGYVGKNVGTEIVECLDTNSNMWFQVGPLNKARSCTTASCVGNRFIYVFPGVQKETWNTIEFMDLGQITNGSPLLDPREFKKLKWSVL